MIRDEPYSASFIGPVGPIHHEEYAFDLLECTCSCATRGRAEVAKGRAEIERLKVLLRRHHLRGAFWDSDLAVETRAALEAKP